MTAIAILVLGLAAIWCGQIAWYLITPTGRLYWDEIAEQERKRRHTARIIREWMSNKYGKDKT